jgi:hypothetical protein
MNFMTHTPELQQLPPVPVQTTAISTEKYVRRTTVTRVQTRTTSASSVGNI